MLYAWERKEGRREREAKINKNGDKELELYTCWNTSAQAFTWLFFLFLNLQISTQHKVGSCQVSSKECEHHLFHYLSSVRSWITSGRNNIHSVTSYTHARVCVHTHHPESIDNSWYTRCFVFTKQGWAMWQWQWGQHDFITLLKYILLSVLW